MISRTLAFVVCSLSLVGCGENLRVATLTDEQHLQRNEVLLFLHDTTVKTYSTAHGTQIEYLGRDNQSVLVYPNNHAPLYGRWAVRYDAGLLNICFKYDTQSYNPVTGVQGGHWECEDLRGYARDVDEIYDGDLFALDGSTTLLRRMPADQDISIPTALRAVGMEQPSRPNKRADFLMLVVR